MSPPALRVSAAEFRLMTAEGKPRGRANKFNARLTEGPDGIVHHSAGEAARWEELKLQQRMGEVRELRRQVRFPLSAGGKPVMLRGRDGRERQAAYVADFTYVMVRTGRVVVEDFKGFDHKEGALKRAVLQAETGVEVLLTGREGRQRAPRKGRRKVAGAD